MHNKAGIKTIILMLTGCVLSVSLATGDTLMLKSGKSYSGMITRVRLGRIALKTSAATREYDEELVSWKLTKFTPPQDPEKTLELLKNGKYAEALPEFEKWGKRYNELPTVWYEAALYGMGVGYAYTGKVKQGITYLEKLLKDFPDSRFKNDAEFFLIDFQTSGAAGDDIEERLLALISDPATSDRIRTKAHMGLGAFYSQKKEWKKALEQYVSVVVLHGDVDELQEDAQVKCGELFLQTGRTNEATFYFKQIQEVYPESASAEQARKQLSLLANDKGE